MTRPIRRLAKSPQSDQIAVKRYTTPPRRTNNSLPVRHPISRAHECMQCAQPIPHNPSNFFVEIACQGPFSNRERPWQQTTHPICKCPIRQCTITVHVLHGGGGGWSRGNERLLTFGIDACTLECNPLRTERAPLNSSFRYTVSALGWGWSWVCL